MKLLKLTRKSDGMGQYINPAAISYFHWDDDRNYTEVWITGEAPSNGPVAVTETPEAIAAMLAETVAPAPEPVKYTYASTQETECGTCGKRKHTPLKCSSMGGYVCLTCVAEVLDPIEPLDGACVRTLPTPQGARRFLCLPEVDMTTPVEGGEYLFFMQSGPALTMYVSAGTQWREFAGYARICGPLPPEAP